MNLIYDTENSFLFIPKVCTLIHFGVIAITLTLVLFVNPSRLLRFLSTMQVCLNIKFKICGGTPFLLKLFNTSSVNMLRNMLCGSSHSASASGDARISSVFYLFVSDIDVLIGYGQYGLFAQ